MSGIRRDNFFILVQPLHDLERISASKTFPLSVEIAVTTSSVDEKTFLYHLPSTDTPTSAVYSVPRSSAAASDILFSTTCLDGAFIE